MKMVAQNCSRRSFLSQLGSGTAAFAASALFVPGAFADELVRTPRQAKGPFYPNKLPLDTDNDLLVINDGITPAVGEITHLAGRILSASGVPLNNAVVEIWQCDAHGVYLHTSDSDRKKDRQDKHFQGFGRFLTGSTGEYYFRTIKPVPYPGRTPHIHFRVTKGGKELLTTQCYVKGHPGNDKDGIYRSLGKTKARDSVTVDFAPLEKSKLGELVANFNIVLDVTPTG